MSPRSKLVPDHLIDPGLVFGREGTAICEQTLPLRFFLESIGADIRNPQRDRTESLRAQSFAMRAHLFTRRLLQPARLLGCASSAGLRALCHMHGSGYR